MHVVTDDVLEKGGKDDSVSKPLMIWKKNVEALSPRKFFMVTDDLVTHLKVIFGNDESTETV